MTVVATESARQPEVLELMRLGDEFALSLYPADSCYMLDMGELEAPGVTVFVARDPASSAALGMAALVDRGNGTAEIKRMFVLDSARGRGVASDILRSLEQAARASVISTIQLETGPKQGPAIALYERHGFVHIPNFGPYIGDEFSVCMEKVLATPAV